MAPYAWDLVCSLGNTAIDPTLRPVHAYGYHLREGGNKKRSTYLNLCASAPQNSLLLFITKIGMEKRVPFGTLHRPNNCESARADAQV